MFEPSGIYKFDPGGTVYSRTEALGSATGVVGYAYNAVKSAFFGEASDRLLPLTYETLTTQPAAAIARAYDFIGEAAFDHDFNAIDFEASSFDRSIGAPHLHAVRRSIDAPPRATILPPDLFTRYENDRFWLPAGFNPRGVVVV
jgi:sulfotransferase